MLKKKIVNNGIYEKFWISNVYFLEKRSMIFQKSLIKSLIHKIKKHKNFQNILTRIDRRN